MGIRQLLTYCISDLFIIICLGIFLKARFRRIPAMGMLAVIYHMNVSLEFLRFWLARQGVMGRYTILLTLVIGVGMAFFIAEYRDSRTLFTILMAASYSMFGSMTAKILNLMEVPLGQVIAAEILVHLTALFLLVRFFLPSFRELQQLYRKEWRLFGMVLGMLVCCMYLLYDCLKRPDVTVFHNLVPLFYLLCIYVILTLALRLLVRVREEEAEASRRKILAAGMEVLKREVAQVRQSERRIAAYNHDSRHVARMLAGMMAEGNYEGVERALLTLPSFDSVMKTKRYCENLAFNGILASYAGLAEERGIDIRIQAAMPEYADGNNWECAVLFDCLLEQAVELSGGIEETNRRKIHVRIVPENSRILYEIRSTFTGAIPFDRAANLPVFSCQERRGFGMKSIRFHVERRNGTLECGTHGEWYYVRVLMPS